MGAYTSRRTYLLGRAAWGLLIFAAAYAYFAGESRSWLLVILFAALAVLCWVVAGAIEKKRRRKESLSRDENGNAVPNKL